MFATWARTSSGTMTRPSIRGYSVSWKSGTLSSCPGHARLPGPAGSTELFVESGCVQFQPVAPHLSMSVSVTASPNAPDWLWAR